MPEGSHPSPSPPDAPPGGEDSPRSSTASIGSNERAPSATPSDCSERRPASLISSGSGSSRDDAIVPPSQSSAPDIDLELSPAEGEEPGEVGHALSLQRNNNNSYSSSSRRLQTALSAKTMSPNPQLSYLDRVVMEIIETERMYVRDLRMIVEDYLAHIIDQCEVSIRPETVCALFGNIEDIYEFNSELLQDLDLCDLDPVAIARCFVLKSDYFDIYTQYCTNYPNSVAALTDCMRNKSLAKFFRERQAALKRSLPLGSYLLKPVQRILKYHLLLQEIAKHFDPQQAGFEVVEEAIYSMTGVAWYINDMKRKHEHAVRLQEVQSLLLNWKGADLTTYGELVLEGTFKVHRAKNERTLFLFDRMLLITKRRGEHFVYKTHISCSTLMLIESAKDSLCFSVTHYKHPKQSHTVQAKTVEERKLWAHHIKRIILENHHAIIPQKAKEAILEMDSIYPSRYRYSPERLKKALSCQADECPRDGRHGRRQSEPTKQILKNTRAILKHADSEGALLWERHPLQPDDSISTLGSSLQLPGEEGEGEDPGSRKDSVSSPGEQGSDQDDIVMEDDQVADFASFMLAAISCWHYRARALLSTGVMATDEEASGIPESGQPAAGEETCGNEPTHREPATDTSLQEETSDAQPPENLEPDLEGSSATPPLIPASPPLIPAPPNGVKAQTPEEIPEEQSAATPDSDSRTLSSAGSSEEEEDEEKDMAEEEESEASSILPSSVLDKASSIAQHFNSLRRGSQPLDDARSLGCSSPRVPSRLNSSCSELPETFSGADLTLLSPRDDGVFGSDRGTRRRRDSTLSMQDQLLIGKIRNYYEAAESQDAAFGLRRRESLSYIPTGLVRSSVSRFNSIPREEPSAQTTSSFPDQAEPDSGAWDCLVSGASFDPLVADQRSAEPEASGFYIGVCPDSVDSMSGPRAVQEKPAEDEEFRPSSEMIKIWQAMEQQTSRSKGEGRGRGKPLSRAAGQGLSISNMTPNKNSDRADEESDLSTITEESPSPSPFKHLGVNRARSLRDVLKVFGGEGAVLRAPVPRVAQLKAEAEGREPRGGSDQTDDPDTASSRVKHLARQYSQRLKTSTPTARQRGQDKKNLPCVMEEKESSGKPNLTLPLVPCHQVTTLPLSPIEQVCSPSPTHSPRGPLSSLTERFHWPDVRELRSKYGRSPSEWSQQQPPVGRSLSVPERMLDDEPKRRSSCSSSLADEVSQHTPHLGRAKRSPQLHRANSLDHRLRGRPLQKLQAKAPDGGYYVSAAAALSNAPGRKIIVMEKLPEPGPDPAEAAEKTKEAEEEDDNYIQIRSPMSREKISIMAVIDRCRAYQESDEYKQRAYQESDEYKQRAKAESSLPVMTAPSPGEPQGEAQNTGSNSGEKTEAGAQSMVKNLREKFQSLR